jgi:hypothetical protein
MNDAPLPNGIGQRGVSASGLARVAELYGDVEKMTSTQ